MLKCEIYLRWKPYLVVKISTNIVTEHCCQVCVLFMMFCHSDCWLCGGMCGKIAIMWCQEIDIYIYISITVSTIDIDFLHQFTWHCTNFHSSFQCKNGFQNFQKVSDLWMVGKVVNHVGSYGSKAAEGWSAFQHRFCILCSLESVWSALKSSVLREDTVRAINILLLMWHKLIYHRVRECGPFIT